jgi:hypothetical protein
VAPVISAKYSVWSSFDAIINSFSPPSFLQPVPDIFCGEIHRLSQGNVFSKDTGNVNSFCLSSETVSCDYVAVELYHCGYMEKVRTTPCPAMYSCRRLCSQSLFFPFSHNLYLQVGGSVKTWHWRWFEIDQLHLSYYRSHHHSQPIRRIPLSHVLSVKYALHALVLRGGCFIAYIQALSSGLMSVFIRASNDLQS